MGFSAFVLYTALVILASFNRETTGALLIGLYWAFYGLADWRRLAFLAALWAVITLGLHLAFGAAPAQFGGLAGTLEMNQATLPNALFSNALLAPLWIGAALRWRGSGDVLKRLCVCGLLYVVAFAVGAVWQEVRLLMVLFPLVLPVILKTPDSPSL